MGPSAFVPIAAGADRGHSRPRVIPAHWPRSRCGLLRSFRRTVNHMRVVVTSLVGLGLFLSGIAAASGQMGGRDASSAVPLGARPAAVTRFCFDRARRDKFTVLCPTRYPRTSQSEVTPSGSSLLGPSFYWASFNDAAGFDNDDDGHLVFGGQRPPFSLAGSPGQAWPLPSEARPAKQLNLPRLLMTPMQDGRQYVAQRPHGYCDTPLFGHDRRSSSWPRRIRPAVSWVDT